MRIRLRHRSVQLAVHLHVAADVELEVGGGGARCASCYPRISGAPRVMTSGPAAVATGSRVKSVSVTWTTVTVCCRVILV